MTVSPPQFDQHFIESLDELMIWRRDVRHFKPDKVDQQTLHHILDCASELSPSVGNSQPWRIISVESPECRFGVLKNFETCNADALNDYSGDQAKLYAKLKLAGLKQAPEQFAIFTDISTTQGKGLGKKTMPEMLHYSTVCMVMNLWLLARARDIGIGWVSIIDPDKLRQTLDVSDDWQLSAYLCVGYPGREDQTPELERVGWQSRKQKPAICLKR